jgi:hypothetical protein
MICYGPTVHIYLRTKWRLFVCQYCHRTTPAEAPTTLAEAQLWLSGIATPVSLTWFYGPRSCYSNTPTQRSGPNSLIKPLWQLLASILGKTF